MKIIIKKYILCVVFGLFLAFTVTETISAKTKIVNIYMEKTDANEVFNMIRRYGNKGIKSKTNYSIVIRTKKYKKLTKQKKQKFKMYLQKVMDSDANQYGLIHDASVEEAEDCYINSCWLSARDIVYCEKIIEKSFKDDEWYWSDNPDYDNYLGKWKRENLNFSNDYDFRVYVNDLINTASDFRKLSDSEKTLYLLDYLSKCMTYRFFTTDEIFGESYYTWKKLYKKKAEGVCDTFVSMYKQAIPMIGPDVHCKRIENLNENHAVILIAAKNSKGKYEYFEGTPGAVYPLEKRSTFLNWVNNFPDTFGVDGLEKKALCWYQQNKNNPFKSEMEYRIKAIVDTWNIDELLNRFDIDSFMYEPNFKYENKDESAEMQNSVDWPVLKKIIEEQKAKGALIATDFNSYYWNDQGRLTMINWTEENVSGKLDLSSFTALESVNLEYNSLEELDVSGCDLLENLNCGENNLHKLNICNRKLLELDCTNNQLTELFLENAKELTTLKCRNNNLVKLDISDCINLLEVDCCQNQLSELDISQNNMLSEILCHYNLLTELDVSRNNMLSELICHHNLLTELDVSHNNMLLELICSHNQLKNLNVIENKELQYLDCGNNQLNKLDLSKNMNLQTLQCEDTHIKTLDVSKCQKTILEITVSYKMSTKIKGAPKDVQIFKSYY